MFDPAAKPAVVLPPGRRSAVTAGLLLGIFLSALEATVISTAMPTVVASLGGLEHYSWVFSAYLLSSTATVPLWGRLSDLYGRRPIYLAAIALFLIGSALAGVSTSMPQLIAFRLVQGLGAGGLVPLALTIIGEIYTLEERTRMQAVFSSVWGVSSIVGPLVGGVITDTISWRWVFFVNLPIGLIAAVVVQRTLPEPPETRRVSVDWLGGLLLLTSIALVLVALSELSVAAAALAAVCLIALARVERAAPHPILPLSLVRNPTVAVATGIGFLAGVALFGTLAFIPLLIQVTTGGSATSAGRILTPLYLTWVLASIVAARVLMRWGARISTVVGMASVCLAAMALPWLAGGASSALVFADMALMGTGLGFAMLSLLLAVQHSVPRAELGAATSLNIFARSIGGAVGVSVMGAILATSLGDDLAVRAALEGGVIASLSGDVRHHFAVALQRAFAVGAVASAAGVLAALYVPPLSPAETSADAMLVIDG